MLKKKVLNEGARFVEEESVTDVPDNQPMEQNGSEEDDYYEVPKESVT